MNSVIIDGNNLIHKVPVLKKVFMKDKEAARLSLIESVKSRLGNRAKVVFVFDGHGSSVDSNIIFSNDKTADELIRMRIEKAKEHKKLTVVSSDNGISALAKVCGCEVRNSEEFWNEINKQASVTGDKLINQNYIYDKLEKPERMSKREIDEFRKYFT